MEKFKGDLDIKKVWKCKHCKGYLNEDSKFCPKCGWKVKWRDKYEISFYDIGKAEGINWMEVKPPTTK